MSTTPIRRDERTEAVENAAYRLAYVVVSFGLLVSIVYRSFFMHQNTWDLLAVIVIGGLVAGLYQWRRGVWSRRWALALVVAAVAAIVAVIALIVVLTR